MGHPEVLFSPGSVSLRPSASPHRASAPAPNILHLSPFVNVFLLQGNQDLEDAECWVDRDDPSP